MKKLASLLLITALLAPTGMVKAAENYSAGEYKASASMNVRTLPSMAGKKIGNINKDSIVRVSGQKGSWCKVEWKNYRSAYVYCSLLTASTAVIAPVTPTTVVKETTKPVEAVSQDVAAVQSLREVKNWLDKDNGQNKSDINNSLQMGLAGAQQWQDNAYFASAFFNFAADGSNSCMFEFDSSRRNTEIFTSKCRAMTDSTALGTAVTGDGTKKEILDPALKLGAMIDQILSNTELVAQINKAYAATPKIKADISFAISADTKGVAQWNVVIKAGNKRVNISTPADQATATFSVK